MAYSSSRSAGSSRQNNGSGRRERGAPVSESTSKTTRTQRNVDTRRDGTIITTTEQTVKTVTSSISLSSLETPGTSRPITAPPCPGPSSKSKDSRAGTTTPHPSKIPFSGRRTNTPAARTAPPRTSAASGFTRGPTQLGGDNCLAPTASRTRPSHERVLVSRDSGDRNGPILGANLTAFHARMAAERRANPGLYPNDTLLGMRPPGGTPGRRSSAASGTPFPSRQIAPPTTLGRSRPMYSTVEQQAGPSAFRSATAEVSTQCKRAPRGDSALTPAASTSCSRPPSVRPVPFQARLTQATQRSDSTPTPGPSTSRVCQRTPRMKAGPATFQGRQPLGIAGPSASRTGARPRAVPPEECPAPGNYYIPMKHPPGKGKGTAYAQFFSSPENLRGTLEKQMPAAVRIGSNFPRPGTLPDSSGVRQRFPDMVSGSVSYRPTRQSESQREEQVCQRLDQTFDPSRAEFDTFTDDFDSPGTTARPSPQRRSANKPGDLSTIMEQSYDSVEEDVCPRTQDASTSRRSPATPQANRSIYPLPGSTAVVEETSTVQQLSPNTTKREIKATMIRHRNPPPGQPSDPSTSIILAERSQQFGNQTFGPSQLEASVATGALKLPKSPAIQEALIQAAKAEDLGEDSDEPRVITAKTSTTETRKVTQLPDGTTRTTTDVTEVTESQAHRDEGSLQTPQSNYTTPMNRQIRPPGFTGSRQTPQASSFMSRIPPPSQTPSCQPRTAQTSQMRRRTPSGIQPPGSISKRFPQSAAIFGPLESTTRTSFAEMQRRREAQQNEEEAARQRVQIELQMEQSRREALLNLPFQGADISAPGRYLSPEFNVHQPVMSQAPTPDYSCPPQRITPTLQVPRNTPRSGGSSVSSRTSSGKRSRGPSPIDNRPPWRQGFTAGDIPKLPGGLGYVSEPTQPPPCPRPTKTVPEYLLKPSQPSQEFVTGVRLPKRLQAQYSQQRIAQERQRELERQKEEEEEQRRIVKKRKTKKGETVSKKVTPDLRKILHEVEQDDLDTPEIIATRINMEREGVCLTESPAVTTQQIVGKSLDPPIDVGSVAPAPFKDLVIPLTAATSVPRDRQTHDIEMAALAVGSLPNVPLNSIVSQSGGARTPAQRPRKMNKTFEEIAEEAGSDQIQDMGDSIFHLSGIMGGTPSRPGSILEISRGSEQKSGIQFGPNNNDEFQCNLQLKEPKRILRVQLRGSGFPSWFPGFFSQLPNMDDIEKFKSIPDAINKAHRELGPECTDAILNTSVLNTENIQAFNKSM